MAELSEIVAFDKGAIAFARSTVYKVSPKVAPIEGGTKVRVHVTGIPYEAEASKMNVQVARVESSRAESLRCG